MFVAKRGRGELTTTILAPGELADLVERMLRTSGRRIDMSTPFVDAMMPDGSRLHVVIPDITRRHMAVNSRKFVLQAHSLDELVALGTLTNQAARFLEAAVASGLNLLVSGGTQAGKTTLLNGLRAAMLASELVITGEGLPAPGSVHARRGRPSFRSVNMRMDYAATRSLDRVRSVRLLTSGLARVPSTGAPFRGATWQRSSRLGLWVR